MKILAIRGENLASLAGAFELDLSAEPFSEAGLFMISGPTGAGKSTILDAICLALFDRTPRLQGRGRKVGFLTEGDREVLNSLDPRCLLRRGAAEGFAEVDFEGVEDRRWRATWSVRRARLKPEGRLQPQTLRLVDLETGIAHGGTKTQTLEAIEEALGLDYDGFCRSVVLAQGEFASFLRAAPTEKAALLERVTGTWLYGKLSIAAHRRASWARQHVARCEAELDGLTLLREDDRKALEAQRAAALAELEATRTQLKEAERALTWRVGLSEREQTEAKARAAFEAADAAWLASARERAELLAAEAAQPLRGRLETHDAALATQAKARLALETRTEEAKTAHASLTAASAAATTAQAASEAARTARADRGPELEQALALDTELRQAEAAAREAIEARAKADRDVAATEQLWRTSCQERAVFATRRAGARAWLAAHVGDAALAGQWPRWERLLERLVSVSEGLPTCEAQLAERRAASETAHQAWEQTQAEAENARQALETAEASWRAEQERGPDPRQEREALEERRLTLVELRGLGERIAAAGAAAATAREAGEVARTSQAEARELGRTAAAEAERLTALLGEAERALEAARASLGLTEQRHELVEGCPCPLCGACEHPYAEDLPPFSRFLGEQAERVTSLRTDLAAACAGVERAAVQGEHAAARAADAQRATEGADAERRAAEERWLARAWTAGWSLGEALIGEGGDLSEQAEAAAIRLEALLSETCTKLEAARQREEALERAREVVSQRREARAATREAFLKREQETQAARREVTTAACALEEQRALRLELLAELAPAFSEKHARDTAGWQDAAQLQPRAFTERCRAAAAAYAGHSQQEREAAETLTRIEPELTAAAERLEAGRARQAEIAAVAEQRERTVAERRTRREALLGGRPVDVVRAELEGAVGSTRLADEAARAGRSRAAEAAATAEARRTEAQAALTAASAAVEARTSELQADLAAAAIDAETLRQRLRRDGAWLAATRRRRDDQGQTRTACEATLAERTAQRKQHAERGVAPGWTGETAPTLEARLSAASERATAAEERLRGVAARLDADARARERAESLAPVLERHRRLAEVWQSLNSLIGSADGKSFRVFAQSLTLELLLEQANAYLADLAPRYQLQRVRGADLDLQVVDRVMGDEVRAVSSLSGGETFLASLALALGLSSLSAKDTRVDSLFIDEGFGSLDPESQELALATLDALQASGRQVALISHVPGLAERIGVGVQVVPQGQGQSELQVA